MKKIMVTVLATGMIVASMGMLEMAQAVPTPPPADPLCAVGDMQLNGQNADACSGPNAGTDSVGAINSLGGLFAGNGWTLIAKDEPPGGASASGSLGGINFSLLASGSGTSVTGGMTGTWDLTWSGTFPATIDLVAILKAGDKWSAFLFDNELLTAAGTNNPDDLWKITFFNNGGNYPNLSHLSLYGRDVEQPVPEPASMLLLGSGLVGLAALRRKGKI